MVTRVTWIVFRNSKVGQKKRKILSLSYSLSRLVLVAVEKCRIILFEDAEQKAIFSIEEFIKDQETVEVIYIFYLKKTIVDYARQLTYLPKLYRMSKYTLLTCLKYTKIIEDTIIIISSLPPPS